MADAVWNTNCKGSIQQPSHETNSIRPSASVVVIFSPDLRIASVLFRHHCEDNHGRDEAAHRQSEGNAVDERNISISQTNNGTACPIDDLKHNEYLPRMPFHCWMFKQIHGHAFIPQHGAH